MRGRIITAFLVVFGLGVGLGVLLFSACGRAAPVTVRLADSTNASALIRVYVSGAVRTPGVYPLHGGDRVVEAVEAAGGPAPDADTEAVNFAQRLQDEQHLHVPRVGETPATPAPAGPRGSAQPLDINRADASLLSALPAIGSVRAQQIVDSRQRAGPFTDTKDLVQRSILTQSTYEQVKDLIEVAR
jgi:competence protein ComEA